ncbi:hypothetical protein Bsp3421_002629 [Burkholderia sp. FERM BP-3421]|jgi:hypothetical protein|uniref:hypothetical protein n=1 Tax=Burkholderia sp. FERM BP-3421 TaxID=1494466 RepID=UPI0023623D10|nr:hypothetical protein [Burkholderia sp. FERM BP-3421]WDD92608.1 hypothetical protein Bsp3421_002629 [Burkholderia sp. FERM BP-3421]
MKRIFGVRWRTVGRVLVRVRCSTAMFSLLILIVGSVASLGHAATRMDARATGSSASAAGVGRDGGAARGCAAAGPGRAGQASLRARRECAA